MPALDSGTGAGNAAGAGRGRGGGSAPSATGPVSMASMRPASASTAPPGSGTGAGNAPVSSRSRQSSAPARRASAAAPPAALACGAAGSGASALPGRSVALREAENSSNFKEKQYADVPCRPSEEGQLLGVVANACPTRRHGRQALDAARVSLRSSRSRAAQGRQPRTAAAHPCTHDASDACGRHAQPSAKTPLACTWRRVSPTYACSFCV